MKIICIGWNYPTHAQELSGLRAENPVFFLKPDTALLRNNQPFYYPEFTQELHYEVELVLKVCKVGRHISEKFASRYYNEIGIGIDFTARDLQRTCKETGQPWEIAKAFDYSAPISNRFIPAEEFANLADISFSLKKNDEIVQSGNSGEMVYNFDRIVAYVSQFFTLKIGDLIFTGTPAGAGPVAIGDRLTAAIQNKVLLDFEVL